MTGYRPSPVKFDGSTTTGTAFPPHPIEPQHRPAARPYTPAPVRFDATTTAADHYPGRLRRIMLAFDSYLSRHYSRHPPHWKPGLVSYMSSYDEASMCVICIRVSPHPRRNEQSRHHLVPIGLPGMNGDMALPGVEWYARHWIKLATSSTTFETLSVS